MQSLGKPRGMGRRARVKGFSIEYFPEGEF
jgi:hypothetical protein